MKLAHVRPTHLAPDVEAITPETLRQHGLEKIKYILWDFGGTLAQHDATGLEPSVVAALKKLEAAGIKNIIHSNAYKSRVENLHRLVRDDTGISMALTPVDVAKDGRNPKWYAKPSPAMLLEFKRSDRTIRAHEILIVGDQMTKDVLAANRSGVSSVLVLRRGKGDDWRILLFQRPVERILYGLLRLPKMPTTLSRI